MKKKKNAKSSKNEKKSEKNQTKTLNKWKKIRKIEKKKPEKRKRKISVLLWIEYCNFKAWKSHSMIYALVKIFSQNVYKGIELASSWRRPKTIESLTKLQSKQRKIVLFSKKSFLFIFEFLPKHFFFDFLVSSLFDQIHIFGTKIQFLIFWRTNSNHCDFEPV